MMRVFFIPVVKNTLQNRWFWLIIQHGTVSSEISVSHQTTMSHYCLFYLLKGRSQISTVLLFHRDFSDSGITKVSSMTFASLVNLNYLLFLCFLLFLFSFQCWTQTQLFNSLSWRSFFWFDKTCFISFHFPLFLFLHLLWLGMTYSSLKNYPGDVYSGLFAIRSLFVSFHNLCYLSFTFHRLIDQMIFPAPLPSYTFNSFGSLEVLFVSTFTVFCSSFHFPFKH